LRNGEEVRISGNVPTLGLGNPEKAIPLVTSPSAFPWWVTKEGNNYLIKFFIIYIFYYFNLY